jgi:hypothetical protein
VLPTQPLPTIRPLRAPPLWPEGLKAIPARQVETRVLAQAGARPWDRDSTDLRLVEQVRKGTGALIDDEAEVGGYPK